MIELAEIRKFYNRGRPNEFCALDGIDLALEMEQVTVLKGPSGSGKTTLLSIVGCMARPTSGRVTVLGREVTSLPERFLNEVRRETFGFIFQQFNLVKGLSVQENVMLPALPSGELRSVLKRRAGDLLSLFNLSGKAGDRIEWLSGGEAQRVAIARALINDPVIIIADEPTAHLDTALSIEFLDIMAGLKSQGKTIIMASHDPLVCEAVLVDRLVPLRDGRLVT